MITLVRLSLRCRLLRDIPVNPRRTLACNIGQLRHARLAGLGFMFARSRCCPRVAYPCSGAGCVSSERLEPVFSCPKMRLTFGGRRRMVVSLRWAGVAQG